MPSSPSRLVAVVLIRSRSSSASSRTSCRRRSERFQDRHRHAGVAARRVDGEVGRVSQSLDARAVLPPFGQAVLPQFGLLGGEVGGGQALLARVVLIDPGLKVFAARFGNVSSRFARSPLGSMTIAGMPSIAASSSRAMQRPVLPLPVMPTQTAWVTRSFES